MYNVQIYPATFFCGYNQDLKEYDIKPDTISVHHYSSTWKKRTFKERVQNLIKNLIGKKRYLILLKIKRKLFGIHEG